MHTDMLLCFHRNVFKYAVVTLIGTYLIAMYKCCLIYVVMIYRIKWHENSITCMAKHRPVMYYKNVKKLLKYCVVK